MGDQFGRGDHGRLGYRRNVTLGQFGGLHILAIVECKSDDISFPGHRTSFSFFAKKSQNKLERRERNMICRKQRKRKVCFIKRRGERKNIHHFIDIGIYLQMRKSMMHTRLPCILVTLKNMEATII